MPNPRLQVARTPIERVLQVAALGATGALLVYAWRVWADLPAAVPTHFGISGAPDAWGSRASLLALPALAAAFFFGLTVLERVPHLYNYPVEITAANAARVYAIARRLVLVLKLILVVAFGLIFHYAVDVALGRASSLPGWFLPAVVGSTVGLLVVTIVSMRRTRAVARG